MPVCTKLFVNRLISAKQYSMIESQKKYVTSEGCIVRLIMLYGKDGMFNHARKLFDEMTQFKCEHTVMSFNALLSLDVNLTSYNIVIHALCLMGSMFDELKKNGLEPDLVTYNTLLEALYKNDRCGEDGRYGQMMESKNIAPDIISYHSKIGGIARDNRTSGAITLIDEMKRKKVVPDKINFHELIKPDNSIYLTLLPFLCEVGDSDTAMEICSKAINDQSFTKVGVLTSVVNALLGQGKFDEAIELV